MTHTPDSARLSRRALLGGAGAAGAGLVLGAGTGALARDGDDPAAAEPIAFHGARQAGIVTPAQDRLLFASFDLVTTDRAELRDLLRTWSDAGAGLAAGHAVGPEAPAAAPPADTGEAAGLPPARLTLTFGYGPSLFDERFGLASRRPAPLRELPLLPGDELDPDRSGGDLCVQACGQDPQVLFHAIRNLTRAARGVAVLRWAQEGFGRTSSTTRTQETPRNLMGFKDGTNNITAEEPVALREHVWAGSEAPAWLRGGTYLVARRIRMLIEGWDRAPLADQEATIGRTKLEGAPLGRTRERDDLALGRRGADGLPVIPADAHVRLASPEVNDGIRVLRRGYSFTDGVDADLGQLDAGLFFLAFMRDPKQFVALQQRLGGHDALNEYIKHVSSAVFAIPPGIRPGRPLGSGLL